MAEPATFFAWAESLSQMTYYEILRVSEDATNEEIQEAFHALSLRCHPDRFVDDGPEVAAAAASVFKRAAEAYNVLRKPMFRQRYDKQLRNQPQTQAAPERFDEHKVEVKKQHVQRTLLMIAQTPKGKKHAALADELLTKGDLDKARIQLITASQAEPDNEELKERLQILYEALMLEPGDFL